MGPGGRRGPPTLALCALLEAKGDWCPSRSSKSVRRLTPVGGFDSRPPPPSLRLRSGGPAPTRSPISPARRCAARGRVRFPSASANAPADPPHPKPDLTRPPLAARGRVRFPSASANAPADPLHPKPDLTRPWADSIPRPSRSGASHPGPSARGGVESPSSPRPHKRHRVARRLTSVVSSTSSSSSSERTTSCRLM